VGEGPLDEVYITPFSLFLSFRCSLFTRSSSPSLSITHPLWISYSLLFFALLLSRLCAPLYLLFRLPSLYPFFPSPQFLFILFRASSSLLLPPSARPPLAPRQSAEPPSSSDSRRLSPLYLYLLPFIRSSVFFSARARRAHGKVHLRASESKYTRTRGRACVNISANACFLIL
jgi:hypothetical protein